MIYKKLPTTSFVCYRQRERNNLFIILKSQPESLEGFYERLKAIDRRVWKEGSVSFDRDSMMGSDVKNDWRFNH
jgi:hypothetical protein